MLAYGVAKQAVLYPNTRDVKEAFVNIWNRPYWQMYGELFYEDIFGEWYKNFIQFHIIHDTRVKILEFIRSFLDCKN